MSRKSTGSWHHGCCLDEHEHRAGPKKKCTNAGFLVRQEDLTSGWGNDLNTYMMEGQRWIIIAIVAYLNCIPCCSFIASLVCLGQCAVCRVLKREVEPINSSLLLCM